MMSPLPSVGATNLYRPYQKLKMQPNIVVVAKDDGGFDRDEWATSADHAQAPFQTLLALNGVRFPYHYVGPSCSTARANLVSGHYPKEHGIGDALDSTDDAYLDPTMPNLFRRMKTGGYAVHFLGKHHLVPDRSDYPFRLTHPIDMGAETWFGSVGNIPVGYDFYNWPAVVNGQLVLQTAYSTKVLFEEALIRMKSAVQPFFLWLAPHAAHEPYHIPPTGTYDRNTSTDLGKYLAAIESMDWYFGQLWASLPVAIQNNTIWIVLWDNGTPKEVTLAPPGYGKGRCGEHGSRTNLFVYSATRGSPGIYEGPISSIDLVPTVLQMAGISNFTALGHPDGRSFARHFDPVLYAADPRGARDFVFWEKFKPSGYGQPRSVQESAARKGWIKLRQIRKAGEPTIDELYDLSTGGEGTLLDLSNLSAPLQQIYDELKTIIADRLG